MRKKRPRQGWTAGWAILALAATATATAAEVTVCEGVEATVESVRPEDARLACAVIAAAMPVLADCHLPQHAPVSARIVDHPVHPGAPCLGLYDPALKQIMLASPARLGALIGPENPLRSVPVETAFQSLVVHELAHALFDQQGRAPGCTADHEYLAYAMQMQQLGVEGRAAILARLSHDNPIPQESLNDFIALAEPYDFAARVWRHFSAPENGCDFVGKIVRGEVSLMLPPL